MRTMRRADQRSAVLTQSMRYSRIYYTVRLYCMSIYYSVNAVIRLLYRKLLVWEVKFDLHCIRNRRNRVHFTFTNNFQPLITSIDIYTVSQKSSHRLTVCNFVKS